MRKMSMNVKQHPHNKNLCSTKPHELLPIILEKNSNHSFLSQFQAGYFSKYRYGFMTEIFGFITENFD